MSDIIKFYFIYLGSIYTSLKIINFRMLTRIENLSAFLLAMLLSFTSFILDRTIPKLTYFIPLTLIGLILIKIDTQPKIAFITTIIGFVISYSLAVISSGISIILIFKPYYNLITFPFELLAILSAIFQIIFLKLLFKLKRFKKGMPFLFSANTINFALIICSILISFLAQTPFENITRFLKLCSFFLFAIALAILIYWWQAQLTKTYKQRLLFRELESLRTELQEKDKLIAHLTEQNQELGRLIHRDNKRIPAMEDAVCEYLAYEFTDFKQLHQRGQLLIKEITALSTSRANTLADINNKHHRHYTTGIVSVDALVNYMAKRCKENNGTLSVHLAVDLQQYIPKRIATEDFSHMLSDLLENAYLATCHLPNARIQLQFYMAEKSFIIEIADNGAPFQVPSLVNFGVTQLTTRGHCGGSGIGLMDIWRIKEKYAATLHIEECETATPYTKKLSFIFNRKNQYTIRTYRKEEIQKLVNRTDLQVYDHVAN